MGLFATKSKPSKKGFDNVVNDNDNNDDGGGKNKKKKRQKKKRFGIFKKSSANNNNNNNNNTKNNDTTKNKNNKNKKYNGNRSSSSPPSNTTSKTHSANSHDSGGVGVAGGGYSVGVHGPKNGPMIDSDALRVILNQPQSQHAMVKEVVEEHDFGDIPKSISTPTNTNNNNTNYGDGNNMNMMSFDSLDSPCSTWHRKTLQQQQQRDATTNNNNGSERKNKMASTTKSSSNNTTNPNNNNDTNYDAMENNMTHALNNAPPSMQHLHHYISALQPQHSPTTSSELPSRALRALFTLSEHGDATATATATGTAGGNGVRGGSSSVRVRMVRYNGNTTTATSGTISNNNDAERKKANNDTAAQKQQAKTQQQQQQQQQQQLVPALLSFLLRCQTDSSEQYLALLVLNNISIPMESKRHIAIDCGGVRTLARLVCMDPKCHLLVIILVNLTFCDIAVRRDLLLLNHNDGGGDSGGGGGELVEALGYALTLASLTHDQLDNVMNSMTNDDGMLLFSPRKLLSMLQSSSTLLLESSSSGLPMSSRYRPHPKAPPLLLLNGNNSDCPFPETAQWCLCAYKNLTRPGKLSPSTSTGGDSGGSGGGGNKNNTIIAVEEGGDAIAAHALLDAGVLPLILRIVRIAVDKEGDENGDKERKHDRDKGGEEYDNIINSITNFPYWQSNSAQDAALYTLLNMASVPGVRSILREECGCVEELMAIVDCGRRIRKRKDQRLLAVVTGSSNEIGNGNGDGVVKPGSGGDLAEKELLDLGQLGLQCMKARMALSYLLGSEGHYGQPRVTGAFSSSSDNSNSKTENQPSKYHSATLLADYEAHSIIELLSHCIHNRAKEGPGGYSAATFTVKGVLHSIRCLMTNPKNRIVFASIDGARLNTLLLKALARYSLIAKGVEDVMDAEAAEHAVFSLYLMSNCGFQESVCFTSYGQNKFLPASFGSSRQDVKHATMKVLSSYLEKDGITPAGSHAANQILLRIKFLHFSGSAKDLAYPGKPFPSKSDFDFGDNLLSAAKAVLAEREVDGVKPKGDIFDRAIIRLRIPADGSRKGVDPKTYSSPLIAIEELSFGSAKIRHSETIDDIAIANIIAGCAEGFSDQAYGFFWRWEDWGGNDLLQPDGIGGGLNNKAINGSDNSTDRTERSNPYAPPPRGIFGMLKGQNKVDEDEPFTIFGFKCGAPMCGK